MVYDLKEYENAMEKLVEKASILIEALPYIKKFRGKEILIKYGGAAMGNAEIRENVLHDLVFMNYVGIKPILIHGGGPAVAGSVVIDTGLTAANPIALGDGTLANQTFSNRAVGATLAQQIIDNPNGYYFNVHTVLNPGGAVRGQLVRQ